MKLGWLIGELSHKLGISPQTIRYYERLGLLDPPKRTESNYRLYSEDAADRLQFIQKAKQFGLSLNEIKTLINIRAGGNLPCASLKAMVKQHLDDLDQRIQEMLAFRQELAQRYEQINALLPDASSLLTEEICQGKICGLIEKDRKDETQSCSNC